MFCGERDCRRAEGTPCGGNDVTIGANDSGTSPDANMGADANVGQDGQPDDTGTGTDGTTAMDRSTAMDGTTAMDGSLGLDASKDGPIVLDSGAHANCVPKVYQYQCGNLICNGGETQYCYNMSQFACSMPPPRASVTTRASAFWRTSATSAA